MPGIQAASGYSTGKSARRASCGWATTIRVGGPGASRSAEVQRPTPARLWASASLYLAVATNDRSSGRARSSGAIAVMRAPSGPRRRPPVSAATSVALSCRGPWPSPPTGAARSVGAGVREALDDLRRDVQGRVPGHDAAAGCRDVEHQREIVLGADAFDHGANAVLDRLQQLLLALLRPLLQLFLALRDTLLLLLQVPLLRLLGSRGERDGLLIERRHGRVELLLQALQLFAEALYFLRERGLRRGVTRRRLQGVLRADVGHLQAAGLAGGGGLYRRSPGRTRCRRALRQRRGPGQCQAHA